jgi:hypothetical protein
MTYTTYLSMPTWNNLTIAMCVYDGTASRNPVSKFGSNPCSDRVHTPFGPLKSGMDELVLTPAPVYSKVNTYDDTRT